MRTFLLLIMIIALACNDTKSTQEAAELLVTSHMERRVKDYQPMKTEIDTNTMTLDVNDERFIRLDNLISWERERLLKSDSAVGREDYDSLVHLKDSLKALHGKTVIDTSIAFWNIIHTYKTSDVKGNPVQKRVKLMANKSLNKIIEEGDDFIWY